MPKRMALIPVDHDPFREPLEAGGDDAGRYAPLPRPAVRRTERPRKTPTGSYKDKTVCVVDHGQFIEVAIALSKDFGTVYYHTPTEFSFPRTNKLLLGEGVPGIKRLPSLWPWLNDIDLFVFPDVNFGPLQVYLVSLGKRVWGSRMGEELESDRLHSKQVMASLGIDIGPYAVVQGMPALRDYLREHENVFVKISQTRGDVETFKSENYELIEPLLDEIDHKLGPRKNIMEFIVEDEIPDAVEIGFDGFTVDGQFAKTGTWGVETKGDGFVMSGGPYEALPEPVRRVNAMLESVLAEYQYRGFFSTEIRVTKTGKAYMIDPCCRCGSPPSELYLTLITNWADILWEGSAATVVDPTFADKWGAELMLKSDWAKENWQPIQFPEEIRDNVRLANLTIIDGKYYFIPQPEDETTQVGAVVALGETMDEAIKTVRDIADEVKGYCIETVPDALDAAKEQIEKLKEFGIDF
jgi:hypothetical protein